MIWIKIVVIRRATISSHPFFFTLTETVLHSLLNLVAVGLRVPSPVPSPVPSLPQNEPAALHSLIEALPTSQPDEWTEEIRKILQRTRQCLDANSAWLRAYCTWAEAARAGHYSSACEWLLRRARFSTIDVFQDVLRPITLHYSSFP